MIFLRARTFILLLSLGIGIACAPKREAPRDDADEAPPAKVAEPPETPRDAEPPPPARLTLLAGGDVSFGRLIGTILLDEPNRELFAPLASLFASADVRLVNLEGPISDQGRETVSVENNLVFNGPPASADALARAHVDVVSTANNHAWDYGQSAMLETLAHLDRHGIAHAGTGATLGDAKKPAILERNGFRLAILSVTDIWNQGPLSKHLARDFVAAADPTSLVESIRAIQDDKSLSAIIVSYHGGVEYQDTPLMQTRDLAIAALDAGADAFIGHHPHVAQGIGFHDGKPIVYSLGNLLMRMHSGKPATEMGLVVKLELTRGAKARLFACPIRIFGIEPLPLAADPKRKTYEPMFFERIRSLSRFTGGVDLGPVGDDGCAPVTPKLSAL